MSPTAAASAQTDRTTSRAAWRAGRAVDRRRSCVLRVRRPGAVRRSRSATPPGLDPGTTGRPASRRRTYRRTRTALRSPSAPPHHRPPTSYAQLSLDFIDRSPTCQLTEIRSKVHTYVCTLLPYYLIINKHPFSGFFTETTWVSRFFTRKVKPI